ncbi:hypothetical protein HDU77_011146 [Chytriomyces hyalinus]|nr:hypothetical protein HDU77_011146 [Chytriomyces hyalinus]
MDPRARRNSAIGSQRTSGKFDDDRKTLVRQSADVEQSATQNSRRKICLCFRTRRGCIVTIAFLILTLLSALGVAAYLLYPRIPTISISEPYVPAEKTADAVRVTGNLLQANETNPFIVEIQLFVNVTVYSPNRINIPTNAILFRGTLLGPDNKTPIRSATGTGEDDGPRVLGQTNRTNFLSMRETSFVMPLSLSYGVTDAAVALGASDVALMLLTERCTGQSGVDSRLFIGYTVSVDLSILTWTGFKPSVSGKTAFKCPNIVALVKSKSGEVGASGGVGGLLSAAVSGGVSGLSALLGF